MFNAPGSASNAITAASCHAAMHLRVRISVLLPLPDRLRISASRSQDAPPGS
jgi:hypothetical protein